MLIFISFYLFGTFISEQIMRTFIKSIMHKINRKKNESYKGEQNKELAFRRFLNILLLFYFTNISRTVLYFIFKKKRIKQTS